MSYTYLTACHFVCRKKKIANAIQWALLPNQSRARTHTQTFNPPDTFPLRIGRSRCGESVCASLQAISGNGSIQSVAEGCWCTRAHTDTRHLDALTRIANCSRWTRAHFYESTHVRVCMILYFYCILIGNRSSPAIFMNFSILLEFTYLLSQLRKRPFVREGSGQMELQWCYVCRSNQDWTGWFCCTM